MAKPKREEFVCEKCINSSPDGCWNGFPSISCHLMPTPRRKIASSFCAQGEWHFWSDRHQLMIPYSFGQWESVQLPDPLAPLSEMDLK